MDARSLVIGAIFILFIVAVVWYMTCQECRKPPPAAAEPRVISVYPRATISTRELQSRLNLGFYTHFTCWHPGGPPRTVYMPFRTPSVSQVAQQSDRCSFGRTLSYLEFLACHSPAPHRPGHIFVRLGTEPHYYRVVYSGEFMPC